jgi:hypothetical protein
MIRQHPQRAGATWVISSGLGHGMVNNFSPLLFRRQPSSPTSFNKGTALNCYAPMPFHSKRAVVELVNESDQPHLQYFTLIMKPWKISRLEPPTSMPNSGAPIPFKVGDQR